MFPQVAFQEVTLVAFVSTFNHLADKILRVAVMPGWDVGKKLEKRVGSD